MNKYYIFEKQVGETPLQALTRLRIDKHIPETVSLSYAGRLDPLASGKLLVLAGEECKKQKEYHAWRKEYKVDVLLGVYSDTGDPLGLVHLAPVQARPSSKVLQTILKNFVGAYESPYPQFSSKTVRGKPLFLWTLEGRLHEIEIPKQHGIIYSIRLKEVRMVQSPELESLVREKISKVSVVDEDSKQLGRDFRRSEVLASWDTLASLDQYPSSFVVATILVKTSSGVYMRTLADDIAKALGTRGIALSIHRTRMWKPLFK
jgi:tRNA pseudouridine55 synthase